MYILVKNISGEVKNWGGRIYEVDEEYSLEDVDRLRHLSDSVFITDLYASEAIINDGNYDLTLRFGLGLLQNNPIVMQDYYVLTEEDDILIGNGKILLLYDDLYSIEE